MEQPSASQSVQTWLKQSKTSGFEDGADVIIVLDDGQELCCHSAFLAAQSQVFCDMFYGGSCKTSAREKDAKWRVPLQNATLKQATSFLELIYYQGDGEFTIDKVRSIMGLLHRLNCPAALQKMDAYLTGKIGHSIHHQPKSWVSVLVMASQEDSEACLSACMQNSLPIMLVAAHDTT